MRHYWTSTVGPATSVGLIVAATVFGAPAQADPADVPGESPCPMLAQMAPGLASAASNLINATSDVHGKTAVTPELAELFSRMGLSNYCSDAETSMRNGQLPNVPGVISDRPDIHGAFGGLPTIPGVPGQ